MAKYRARPKTEEDRARAMLAVLRTYGRLRVQVRQTGKQFEIRAKDWGGAIWGYAIYEAGKRRSRYLIMGDSEAISWMYDLDVRFVPNAAERAAEK